MGGEGAKELLAVPTGAERTRVCRKMHIKTTLMQKRKSAKTNAQFNNTDIYKRSCHLICFDSHKL